MQRLFAEKKSTKKPKNHQTIPLTDNYSIEVPDKFICSISLDIIKTPVIATDGKNYDAFHLIEWFATGSMKSPLTTLTLKKTLTFNTLLYNEIRDFYAECLKKDEEILQNSTHTKALSILKTRAAGLTQHDHDILEIKRYCKRNKIALHAIDSALPKNKNIEQAENQSISYKESLKDALVLLSEYMPSFSDFFILNAQIGLAGAISASYIQPLPHDSVKLVAPILSTLFTLLSAKYLGDFNRNDYKESLLTANIFSCLQMWSFRAAVIGSQNGEDYPTIALKSTSACMFAGLLMASSYGKRYIREHFGFFPQRAEDDIEIIDHAAAPRI